MIETGAVIAGIVMAESVLRGDESRTVYIYIVRSWRETATRKVGRIERESTFKETVAEGLLPPQSTP